jgi:hypothetical protein
MGSKTFDPNRTTFDEGIARIREALEKAGLDTTGRILTSRDDDVARVCEALAVDNVPDGFRKWQLPVFLNCPSQLYITVADAGARAETHSHDEGDGVRFIVSGSINYQGKELSSGDWMFVPAGKEYSFEVGRLGAVMCYCYCCSCA